MSNVTKPVVLLVHGAWHRPLHYRLLINRLREQGFTVLAPPLATSGCDDSIAEKTQRDDVHRIHEVLLPYLDSGRQAIVVAHSYGGVPATEAVEGHTVAERTARGEKGGITAVIYISAILAMQTGESVIGAAGGEYQTLRFHGLDEFTLPLKRAEAEFAFFHDVDEDVRTEAMKIVCDQSRRPFETPVQYTAKELKIPKTYIVCTDDRAIPPVVQRMMSQVSGTAEVEIHCGHSPFLKDKETDQLVRIVLTAARNC